MNSNGLFLVSAGVVVGITINALGQTGKVKNAPWLEPKNPTRLEWLALQKQATEGRNDFADSGLMVNFYLRPESVRTGEIYCDLAYLPTTSTAVVQAVEGGILGRFERDRQVDPWARVRITKSVANPVAK